MIDLDTKCILFTKIDLTLDCFYSRKKQGRDNPKQWINPSVIFVFLRKTLIYNFLLATIFKVGSIIQIFF